jgi:hypothetical protein
LAKKLKKEQMQKAFCILQEQFQPSEGMIIKIGLARVNPHEDISIFQLKQRK